MKIHATCLKCQAIIAVAPENAGKKARCPKCKGVIEIPNASPSQPRTAAPKNGGAADSPQRSRSEKKRQSEPPSGKAPSKNRDSHERPRPQSRVPAQRRRKESADDDLWAQPMSSYSSPAIEEHEYEAYGIAPRDRRDPGEFNPYAAPGSRGSRGNSGSSGQPGMTIPLILTAIGMGAGILLGGIGFAFPPAAYAGAAICGFIGFALWVWGGIKIQMNAFEVDLMTGFLNLLCGPYALYFLFSRWDINQNPFLINLLGYLMCVTAVGVRLIASYAN